VILGEFAKLGYVLCMHGIQHAGSCDVCHGKRGKQIVPVCRDRQGVARVLNTTVEPSRRLQLLSAAFIISTTG